MCQECVKLGEMTQEQLDERMLAGDLSVFPLMDLPAETIADRLAQWVADGEITPEEAVFLAVYLGSIRSGEQ